jgi:hypothetical protein
MQAKQAEIQQILLNKKQTRCLALSKTGTRGEKKPDTSYIIKFRNKFKAQWKK